MKTKYFGDLPIDEKELIFFPDGLPGFEEVKRYALIPFFEGEEGMHCLQSAQSEELAFVLLNPFSVDKDYAPTLTDDDLVKLKSDPNTPLAFYGITVVANDFRDSVINLLCPVVINPEKHLGKQVIMEESSYSMHTPLCDGTIVGEV